MAALGLKRCDRVVNLVDCGPQKSALLSTDLPVHLVIRWRRNDANAVVLVLEKAKPLIYGDARQPVARLFQ